LKVFPHKSTDAWVSRDRLKSSVFCLIMHGWALDATVIHEWPGDVGDLLLQDKGYIFMKNCASIGPSLG